MQTRKLTQIGRVLQILDKSFGLSFAEICTRLNESRDTVSKALHYLHKEGRVTRAMDNDGIQHYNLTDKGKEYLAKEIAQTKGKKTSVIKPIPKLGYTIQEVTGESEKKISEAAYAISTRNNKTNDAWASLVEEAEQRGFAKGYTAGVQEAQRAAYEQGRSSVVRKLTELLS